MPDMGVGTIISAGSSLLGGMMQSDAAENAANIQGQATDRAVAAQNEATKAGIAENRRQFDLLRKDSAPFRGAGSAAIGRLSELLGLGNTAAAGGTIPTGYVSPPRPGTGEQFQWNGGSWVDMAGRPIAQWDADSAQSLSEQALAQSAPAAGAGGSSNPEDSPLLRKFTLADFYADPVTKLGLEFGLNEGRRGLDNMAGARGMRNSGATLKALTRFGEDYAGSKAAESRGRFVEDQGNVYNRLAGVAGSGQTAIQNSGALGASMAGNNAALLNSGGMNIGNLISAGGNARGAASIAGANAMGNGFSTIGNWWNQQNTLDKLMGRGAGSVNPSWMNPSEWSYGVVSPT